MRLARWFLAGLGLALAAPSAACAKGEPIPAWDPGEEGGGGPALPPTKGPRAEAGLVPRSASTTTGVAEFFQSGTTVTLFLSVMGATPGQHGVHLHEVADCSAEDAASAKGHWDPSMDHPHGDPSTGQSHTGDIGNLIVDESGRGSLTFSTDEWRIGSGDASDIVGRAIVVHADADDFVTQMPPGNAGGRVACGEIGLLLADATILPRSGAAVKGQAGFSRLGDRIVLRLDVVSAPPGTHGVHLHETGDCSAPDAMSAGGHWNPFGAPHGELGGAPAHLGDIGNLVVDASGVGSITFSTPEWSIGTGADDDVIGHAIVVHASEDDLTTQMPPGNAGARIGCGEIRAIGGS